MGKKLYVPSGGASAPAIRPPNDDCFIRELNLSVIKDYCEFLVKNEVKGVFGTDDRSIECDAIVYPRILFIVLVLF